MAKAAELMALPQVQRRDEAITFAPTHVTSVELLLKGERYFPRILEDIAAARDHIHMLFYAIRPGAIADAVVDALDERARAGSRSKVAVDAIGSGVDSTSRGLYKRMRASASRSSRTTASRSSAAAASATGASASTPRTPSTSTTAR
jgi:phosphatidylserine/phosphatidylglycerophosphate/cardiolipin synthase-like enzyme